MPSHDLSRLASFFELLEVCLEPFKMANKWNSAVLWAMGKLTHSECLTHLFICLLLAITSFSLYFQLIHYLPINSVKASSIAPDVSPTFFFKATLLECSNKICCRGNFFEKGFEPFMFSVSVWCKCSFFWLWGKLCGVSVFAILVLSGTHVSHCLLTSFTGCSSNFSM